MAHPTRLGRGPPAATNAPVDQHHGQKHTRRSQVLNSGENKKSRVCIRVAFPRCSVRPSAMFSCLAFFVFPSSYNPRCPHHRGHTNGKTHTPRASEERQTTAKRNVCVKRLDETVALGLSSIAPLHLPFAERATFVFANTLVQKSVAAFPLNTKHEPPLWKGLL